MEFERERETETLMGCPGLLQPASQACTPTGDQTHNPGHALPTDQTCNFLMHGMMLQLLQGELPEQLTECMHKSSTL